MSVKKNLDELMANVKKDNPNANWKNLMTGLVILILVALFSVWYFSSSPQDSNILDEIEGGDVSLEEVDGDANDLPALPNNTAPLPGPDETTVLAGEGLWQVAKRVCGEGEAYVYIAEANGFNINWAPVAEGQIIKVSCGEK